MLYEVITKKYDEKYPAGTVISQKPAPGAVVKEERRIYLFISGGESPSIVPELKERSIKDARFALERIGLALGDTSYVESRITSYNVCYTKLLR